MQSWHRKLWVGGREVDAQTIFEINSTTKGSRPAPRMTTVQRDAIASPDDGLLIFNSDDSQYQYYNVGDMEWKAVGGGGVGYQESLGVGNGAASSFPLTLVPSNGNSVLVFLGGAPAELITDYSYNSGTNSIDFVSPPAAALDIYVFYLTEGQAIAVPTPSGTEYVEYITLTGTDITNKYVILAAVPGVASKVKLDWVGQTAQVYTTDFIISGQNLDWNGLAIDGVITAGEILRIVYFN